MEDAADRSVSLVSDQNALNSNILFSQIHNKQFDSLSLLS